MDTDTVVDGFPPSLLGPSGAADSIQALSARRDDGFNSKRDSEGTPNGRPAFHQFRVIRRVGIARAPEVAQGREAPAPVDLHDGRLDEEAFEGIDHGPRRFLGQIVAGIEGATGYVARAFAPD